MVNMFIIQLHQNQPAGDVLVFLTGQEEIETMCTALRDITTSTPMRVYPLYSALPPSAQADVFNPCQPQKLNENSDEMVVPRKIIVATNVAESSITIKNIRYVVDSGRAKIRTICERSGIEQLKIGYISRAGARQRAGRAGRDGPGVVYRVYTEELFWKMSDHAVPEILRTSLGSALLELLVILYKEEPFSVDDILGFPFVSSPSPDRIGTTLDMLMSIGAVTKTSLKDLTGPSRCNLTKLGLSLAAFPLDPPLARLLVLSSGICLTEVTTIVSMIAAGETPFIHTKHGDDDEKAHSRFASRLGDHMTLLEVAQQYVIMKVMMNVIHRYESTPRKERYDWCKLNRINFRTMEMAVKICDQLRGYCKAGNLIMESAKGNMDVIRKCLAKGLFLNSAMRVSVTPLKYRTLSDRMDVKVFPTSSVLIRNPPPLYVVYNELVETNSRYIKICSDVDEAWLKEANGEWFLRCIAGK